MNVIFDIGKVLIDFDFNGFVRGYFDEETAVKVIGATWGNPAWRELDRGVMSDEEVLRLFIASAPEAETEIRFIFAKLGECPKLKASTIPLIQKLKEQGYNVYYLSNYFSYLLHTAPWVMTFTKYCDGGIYSCDVKVTKPDRRIYELLCEKYSLDPAECVFIDDVQENVDGAVEAGMRGILYTGQETDELCEEIG
ncbi:MAG: HAD family phosphatase [Oscillospiraceae bacterium]|nr:HAD family phosphatase [Oscillospiraceae bacterium]